MEFFIFSSRHLIGDPVPEKQIEYQYSGTICAMIWPLLDPHVAFTGTQELVGQDGKGCWMIYQDPYH